MSDQKRPVGPTTHLRAFFDTYEAVKAFATRENLTTPQALRVIVTGWLGRRSARGASRSRGMK